MYKHLHFDSSFNSSQIKDFKVAYTLTSNFASSIHFRKYYYQFGVAYQKLFP